MPETTGRKQSIVRDELGEAVSGQHETTADEAWKAFVLAAKAWSHHLDQWDKVKFRTSCGMVYVTIGREDPYPDSFDEIANG